MNYRIILHNLGKIMLVGAACMLIPFVFSILENEGILFSYIVPIIFMGLTGLAFTSIKKKKDTFYAKEGFIIVSLSWILLSLFGALPFFISGFIPSYLDSLFEIVSGFTTTGASILTDVEALPRSLLFWRSFSHWIGGMGVLMLMLAIATKSDSSSIHLMRAEAPGHNVDKLVSKIKFSARILYIIYVGLTVLQTILLLAGGLSFFDSITTAFSTAGTGGFSVRNAGIAAYDSIYCEIVVTVFMALFGLNFNVYYLMIIGSFSSALKSEEMRWYLGIMISFGLIMALNIMHLYENAGLALVDALFQSSSIMTTTGFAKSDYIQWPKLSQTLIMILMFIGACSGSTGGGLKVSRLIILIKSSISDIKRRLLPNSVTITKLENKIVPADTVNSVNSYFVVYCIIIAVSVVIISIDSAGSFPTIFSSVVSCFNNVGPGLDAIGPTGNFSLFSPLSKLVLIVDMLAGRLEIYPLFALGLLVPRKISLRKRKNL